MKMKLKEVIPGQKFCLETELQADLSKGIPLIYKRRFIYPSTIGEQRLYPEGMIPIIGDNNRTTCFPENTVIYLWPIRN